MRIADKNLFKEFAVKITLYHFQPPNTMSDALDIMSDQY